MKCLDPEAAASLLKLEQDTGGLIYNDFWRDSVMSLAARRLRKTSQLPSYSPHNYGLALDLDLPTVLKEKSISYETLLYMMKKRGWYCHRRDGRGELPEAGHFNYLGDLGEKYVAKLTQDPTTWQRAAEDRIFGKYGPDFQLDLKGIQQKLALIGLFSGTPSGTIDSYTREAIFAFQRTWDLVETGTSDYTLCRVLSFVTADVRHVFLR